MYPALTLQREHIDLINAQLASCWPNEICGYLSGVGGHTKCVFAIHNVASEPATSFSMDPQSQLNALVSVEHSKQSILAIYHSHPIGTNSYPSERDMRSYEDPNCLFAVIMPNEQKLIETLRAFRLVGGRAAEFPISIEPATGTSSQT